MAAASRSRPPRQVGAGFSVVVLVNPAGPRIRVRKRDAAEALVEAEAPRVGGARRQRLGEGPGERGEWYGNGARDLAIGIRISYLKMF